jgi:hypothetical protein
MQRVSDREVANRHQGLLKIAQLKQTFPGVRIGAEAKDEIEYQVYLMIVRAINRAEKNGRVTVLPHDC